MKFVDARIVGEREFLLTWEDGHRSLYSFSYLRFLCPCAGCVDEHTGRRTIKKESIPETISTSEMGAVGNYAVKLRWSDGHQTGIYSYEYLRKICPCGQCGAQVEKML